MIRVRRIDFDTDLGPKQRVTEKTPAPSGAGAFAWPLCPYVPYSAFSSMLSR